MSADEYRAHARKWADLCMAYYGVTPIIYSCLEFYSAYLKGEFDDCPFWTGDVDAARSYVDGEPWTIWQKAIKTIPGAQSPMDYDVLAPGKSLEDLLK